MHERRIRSLDLEDPLEEEMATHSSIPVWEISMDRGAWWATVHGGRKRVGHDLAIKQQQHHLSNFTNKYS